MSHVKTFCAAFAVMLVTGVFSPASAQNSPPVVVELFTSQGCYSCPPAEAYLAELAERTDIVALEFHVDYWDSLTYMWHGQWKDPFSSPQYTARQRDYNVAIRDQSGVYTPQMIIDGRYEAVGSRRPQVADDVQGRGPQRAAPGTKEGRGFGLRFGVLDAQVGPAAQPRPAPPLRASTVA